MAKSDQFPQAKQLLEDQNVRQVLSSPDTKKVLAQLQKTDASQLQAAARKALQGDAAALSGILQKISSNPEAAKAMEALNKKISQ